MITDFYKGKQNTHNGLSFDDIINFDDEKMESEHDYISWIFPSSYDIKSYSNAPLLDKAQAEEFKSNQVLKDNVKKAVNRFLKFLHNTTNWRNPVDRNHARISRLIRFLSSIGMKEEAQKVSGWCQDNSGASKSIKLQWVSNIDSRPSWEEQELKDLEELKKATLEKLTDEEKRALGF